MSPQFAVEIIVPIRRATGNGRWDRLAVGCGCAAALTFMLLLWSGSAIALAQSPRSSDSRFACHVRVADADAEKIEGATVTLRVLSDSSILTATSVHDGTHTFKPVPRKSVEVTVSHTDYESQSFRLDLSRLSSIDTSYVVNVRLGRPGDRYEDIDGRTFAYRSRPNVIAAAIDMPADSMRSLLASLGLRATSGVGTRILLLEAAAPMDRMNSPVLAALRQHPGVSFAGSIRIWNGSRFEAFTDLIRVRIEHGERPAVADSLLNIPGVADVSRAGNELYDYLVRVRPEVGEGIVDIAREIERRRGVVRVETIYRTVTFPR